MPLTTPPIPNDALRQHDQVARLLLPSYHDVTEPVVPDLYDVHTTVARVDEASLEVVMSDDARVPTDRLEATDELCGSTLFVRD